MFLADYLPIFYAYCAIKVRESPRSLGFFVIVAPFRCCFMCAPMGKPWRKNWVTLFRKYPVTQKVTHFLGNCQCLYWMSLDKEKPRKR